MTNETLTPRTDEHYSIHYPNGGWKQTTRDYCVQLEREVDFQIAFEHQKEIGFLEELTSAKENLLTANNSLTMEAHTRVESERQLAACKKEHEHVISLWNQCNAAILTKPDDDYFLLKERIMARMDDLTSAQSRIAELEKSVEEWKSQWTKGNFSHTKTLIRFEKLVCTGCNVEGMIGSMTQEGGEGQECPFCKGRSTDQLVDEIAALQKDKERLDWMNLQHEKGETWEWRPCDDAREAIDAAMIEDATTPEPLPESVEPICHCGELVSKHTIFTGHSPVENPQSRKEGDEPCRANTSQLCNSAPKSDPSSADEFEKWWASEIHWHSQEEIAQKTWNAAIASPSAVRRTTLEQVKEIALHLNDGHEWPVTREIQRLIDQSLSV